MLSNGQKIEEHSPAVLCGPHWRLNKKHLCGSFILISQRFVFELSVANPVLWIRVLSLHNLQTLLKWEEEMYGGTNLLSHMAPQPLHCLSEK